MQLTKIIEMVNGTVVINGGVETMDITSVCSADLLSNVLRYGKKGALLVTTLNQPQVIRSAEISDIPAVLLALGGIPEEGMIALAREKNIVLITTLMPMYTTCGILYTSGLRSCVDDA
ncbi:MAG: DRTGG domain-containing protein [Dissulfurispiraceae bacterium]